jgi:hypothetical protein
MDETTPHAADAGAAADAAQDALDAAQASVPPTPQVPRPRYWPGRVEDICDFPDLAEAREKLADLGDWDDLEIEGVVGQGDYVYFMVSAIDVLSRRVLLCWDGNLRTVEGHLAQAQTPGEHRELPWCQYPGCENPRRELERCANSDGRLACPWHRTYRDDVFVCKMCDEALPEAAAAETKEVGQARASLGSDDPSMLEDAPRSAAGIDPARESREAFGEGEKVDAVGNTRKSHRRSPKAGYGWERGSRRRVRSGGAERERELWEYHQAQLKQRSENVRGLVILGVAILAMGAVVNIDGAGFVTFCLWGWAAYLHTSSHYCDWEDTHRPPPDERDG